MSLHHNHPAPGLEKSPPPPPPHGFNHVWATHSNYRSLEYMIALISWQPSCHQAIMTWKPVEKEWIHKVWGKLRLTKKTHHTKKTQNRNCVGKFEGGIPLRVEGILCFSTDIRWGPEISLPQRLGFVQLQRTTYEGNTWKRQRLRWLRWKMTSSVISFPARQTIISSHSDPSWHLHAA